MIHAVHLVTFQILDILQVYIFFKMQLSQYLSVSKQTQTHIHANIQTNKQTIEVNKEKKEKNNSNC